MSNLAGDAPHPRSAPGERPWPLPPGRPAMRMRWEDLLFAHWPVAPALLRPLVPPPLQIDLWEGQAWVGVIPFRMRRVRPHGLPALPWVGDFAELNVRTYVTIGGRPGVWFFSLDAASRLAVRVARRAYHLPYFDARMSSGHGADGVRYQSRRTHRGAPPAELRATYRPTGEPFRAEAGTLDHWLTARYCLYAVDGGGQPWRGEIDHPPWTLQGAEARLETNTMASAAGIDLPDVAPRLLTARPLDVAAWRLRPVEAPLEERPPGLAIEGATRRLVDAGRFSAAGCGA